MPPEQLPALLLAILAVGYTPGPANIYAMSCSIRYGWRASMRMWGGLLCGFLAAALMAAVAAHFAGMTFKEYVPYLRYLAAAYILYLAWKTYRSGVSYEADAAPNFSSGFIVQLTNAKIILFDLSCYSAFVLPYSERFIDHDAFHLVNVRRKKRVIKCWIYPEIPLLETWNIDLTDKRGENKLSLPKSFSTN